MSQVHPQARTTPLIRAEIKAATGTQAELAARYNVSASIQELQKRRAEKPDLFSKRVNDLPGLDI